MYREGTGGLLVWPTVCVIASLVSRDHLFGLCRSAVASTKTCFSPTELLPPFNFVLNVVYLHQGGKHAVTFVQKPALSVLSSWKMPLDVFLLL